MRRIWPVLALAATALVVTGVALTSPASYDDLLKSEKHYAAQSEKTYEGGNKGGSAWNMVAVGKTPAQLAEDIRVVLAQFIQDPLVSVMVDRPQGTFSQQIRIVGATERPAAIPYRANMTLLDAMIAVGGLSAGGRAGGAARVQPVHTIDPVSNLHRRHE